jgi:hypothetical protein
VPYISAGCKVKAGDVVLRINEDNYPTCRVGDIGVVSDDTPETLRAFGSTAKWLEKGLILVSFHDAMPSPNCIKHLQIISSL